MTLLLPPLLLERSGAEELFWWCAGILTVAAVIEMGRRAFLAGWRCIHRLSEQGQASNEKLDALAVQVADLVAEMHPNGGSSMRDAMVRLEGKQSLIRSEVQGMHEDFAEMKDDTAKDLAEVKAGIVAANTQHVRHLEQHARLDT